MAAEQELLQVPNEETLVSLADMATMNVFAQLKIHNPELLAEITAVMKGEIRRVEIELSIMLSDIRDSFSKDVAELRASGKLPDDHMLHVLMETAHG
jgi:hypothetical protein